MRLLKPILATCALTACGTAGSETGFADQIQEIAREVAPEVERTVGLPFKYPPNVTVRDSAQVRAYLTTKLTDDFPQEEIDRLTLAYRLLRLIPADLDLEALLLDLYSEQVVGYYDPGTDSLYVVEGADPLVVRLIVAHELVHALQAQYIPLDEILRAKGGNDRRIAAQALFEGQGVLASMLAIMPDLDLEDTPDFWLQFRESVQAEQTRMPIFSRSPRILREGLVFPYLGGADWVRWFSATYPDTVPFGPRRPITTEQILHPEKYAAGEGAIPLAFEAGASTVVSDDLGEFEVRVLLTELTGSEGRGQAGAQDWGGDRYGVFEVGDEHAIVWWTVWDTPTAARRFYNALERGWSRERFDGRDSRLELRDVDGHPAVVLVDAPTGWPGLDEPPAVRVVGSAGDQMKR